MSNTVLYPRGAQGLLFDVLFPERQQFRSRLSTDAAHCIVRAMSHLSDTLENTFPSTNEGVIQPFICKVSE